MWLRKSVVQRLRDITQCFSNINLKSVCITYVTFRICHGVEEYLTKLKTKSRVVLTILGANDDRLRLIQGRYQNIPSEDRLCNK